MHHSPYLEIRGHTYGFRARTSWSQASQGARKCACPACVLITISGWAPESACRGSHAETLVLLGLKC